LVIADATQRLAGGLFEYRDIGRIELKGFGEGIQAWQVTGTSGTESRFDAHHGENLSPLVGREEELDLLVRRWHRASTGEGHAVLLSGEPGIGKSRLRAALYERLRGEPHTRLSYFCSPHHRDSMLYPFIAQLERAAGFERDDPPDGKLEKFETLLAQSGKIGAETVGLFADLLGLIGEGRYPPLPQDRQQKREMTLAALLGQLEMLARQRPVLMIFEDAHWGDATSLELLDRLVASLRHLPALLVVTFRPEFQAPWVGQAHVSSLSLSRLTQQETTCLVSGITIGKTLPPEIIDRIVERTDGIPLFVEELTKSLLEGGLLREEVDGYALTGPLPPLAIPSSLQDSLMARLDRLAPVKEVAQIGAAIGREFSYELLAAVARRTENQLRSELEQLAEAGLVFRHGTPPRATFMFKHALVQDAAYSTLLRSQRQELHARIGKALEDQFPETAEAQPEILAQHFAEAGLVEKSVAYWGKAGHRSITRSAMAEAAAQLQKGLDQLALLPDAPQHARQELEFHSALGAVLNAVKGQAAPETGHAYARARELWEQLDSPTEFLRVPFGQSLHHVFRGEFDLALRLDEDLLRLSHQRDDSAGLVLGHLSTGRTLFFCGRFASSRSHSEEALALYDPVSHSSLVHQAGFYPHVNSQAILGIDLFCLGFPDQGVAQSTAAIAEALRLAHPLSLAVTLGVGTVVLSLVGDDAALDEWVEQLIAVASERGFPSWSALGNHPSWVGQGQKW
jgi:predicted ATPase